MIARGMCFVCMALCLGWTTATAGDAHNPWTEMGPLPKDIDKSKYPPHYGKKVEYLPANLRKILWNARVRKDHPRIYFTQGTLPALRKRMKTHPAWPLILKHADNGNSVCNAFAFKITGENKYAERAVKRLLKGGGGYGNALIFDWCFSYIAQHLKDEFENIVKRMAASGVDQERVDKGATERMTFKRLRWSLFTDNRPAGKLNLGWSHIYPVLAHHWPDAEVEFINMWHPDGGTFSDQLAKEVRSIDGSTWWWPNQGKPWYEYNKWVKARFAFASATGVDIQDESVWGPNFNNRLYWAIYNTALDRGVLINHYTGHHNLGIFHEPKTLRAVARNFGGGGGTFHAMNHLAKNPHYQWYINKLIFKQDGGPVKFFRGDPMALIELALWWHPEVKEIRPVGHGEGAPHGLPFGRFLAPGEVQTATFRSGFKGEGDCIAMFNYSDGYCGDAMGDKRAYNVGNLVLFKDEYLISHTPYTPFAGVPWGYSGLCYFDTSTRAKTGYDKTVKPTHYWIGMQLHWIRNFPNCWYMDIKGFESRPEYDYLGAKSTPYYWKPDVSKEWTQQTVFLRPGVLVIFNRAEAAAPQYQPRWILHMKGEWPKITGKRVKALVPDHVEDYDGDEASFTGVLHKSRCHLKVLMPKKRHIRVAHGHLGDTPSTALLKKSVTKVAPRVDKGVSAASSITLKMKYKTEAGDERIVSALRIGAAIQRRPGNFIVKVKKGKLQVTQTAAGKDETFFLKYHPTIDELSRAITELGFPTKMTATYEHWVEGQRAAITTPYDGRGRVDPKKQKKLKGLEGQASAGIKCGFNRFAQTGHLEVRLPTIENPKRNYFLNVITATDMEGKDLAVPTSTLEENEQTATAVIKWPDETVRITFNKTGELAGHIKIEKAGKVTVDRALATKLELENQVRGTDFITGRLKVK